MPYLTSGLGGDHWYGWRYEEADKVAAMTAAAAAMKAVDSLMLQVNALSTATKIDYLNRLRKTSSQIQTYVTYLNTSTSVTQEYYTDIMKYLTVTAIKEVQILGPLVSADAKDPSGKTSSEMVSSRLDVIAQEQQAAAESIIMDPLGWAERSAATAGQTAWNVQVSILKGIWPILLIGGGAVALWMFWPAIRRSINAGALQRGREPGDLIPGTMEQPE